MKRYFIAVLVLFTLFLNAQDGDQPYVFHSVFEEQSLNKIGNTENCCDAIIAAYLAVNPSVNEGEYKVILEEIYRATVELKKRVGQSTNKKKIAKAVFSYVQDEYLEKYEINPHFDELFKTGTFNCVTASALYSILLSAFEVDFAIRRLPSHVYVVIKNGEEEIALESTDPINGVYFVDKSKLVKELANAKIFSNAEFRSSSINQLYDLYVGEIEEEISQSQLLASIYYNFSLEKIEEVDYKEALNLANKSMMIDENKFSEVLRTFIYIQMLGDINEEDEQTLIPLIELSKLSEFNEIGGLQLFDHYEKIANDF